MLKKINNCRLCHGDIDILYNWGLSPIANNFKSKEDLDKPEYEAPLEIFKCQRCHSVQLRYELDSKTLYDNYLYESPPNLIPHFNELVNTTSEFFNLKKDDLIVDIGSNNGILLQEYKKLGFRVLGVEPCSSIAQKAINNGVPTKIDYFNISLVNKIIIEHGYPKCITATNSFAHLSDLDSFVAALEVLMPRDGYFVFENCYLLNTLINKDLGQYYFDHYFYHSIYPLKLLFSKYNLELFHLSYNNIQMGSLRGYVRKAENFLPMGNFTSVEDGIRKEEIFGLYSLDTYQNFVREITFIKNRLIKKLDALGTKVALYGVPAKAIIIIRYFGLEKYISYGVEESSLKIGKFIPGTKIEIISREKWLENNPKHTMIGAYNFASDIIGKNKDYKGEWIDIFK